MDKKTFKLIEAAKTDAKRAINLGNVTSAGVKVGILFGIFAAQPEPSQDMIDTCYRNLNNAVTLTEIIRVFYTISQELNKLEFKANLSF